MRITIIGAGSVGRTLGRLAYEAGNRIIDVICRSKRSAAQAVKFIGSGRAGSSTDSHLEETDLILVSTPDDRIPDSVDFIAARGALIGKPVVLHTSGALSSRVLEDLRELSMSIGSCHPLQTFENPKHAIAMIGSSHFCIEGEPRAVRVARRLVRDIGARYFEIPPEMKGLYHAAAVMASGGVVALLSVSLEMLERCGLAQSQARRVLMPLVEGTVANIFAAGPARALTGPVRRGDTGTVARNLKALAAVDSKAAEIYRILARRAVLLAEEAGKDPGDLEELRREID